ncbi:hypothetical protein X975_11055, partial [Stegodyphus mimosarum]
RLLRRFPICLLLRLLFEAIVPFWSCGIQTARTDSSSCKGRSLPFLSSLPRSQPLVQCLSSFLSGYSPPHWHCYGQTADSHRHSTIL